MPPLQYPPMPEAANTDVNGAKPMNKIPRRAMHDIKPTAALIQKGLDAVLDKTIANRKIVGGVLSVSLHGQQVYERAVGYADRETQQSTKPDTLFRWASLTKPLMAALTLALTERE